MTKNISVIIPVYNSEKYLERCIKSVISQSFTDIEIILVNDGSTDKSLDICKKYAMMDARVKVYSQENLGVSAARNLGLQNVNSEYVAFLDSDDWLEEETYELAVKYLELYTADVYVYGVTFVDGKLTKQINENIAVFDKYTALKEQITGKIFHLTVCDKVFRKSQIKNLCFDESLTMGEDLLFSWQSLKHADTVIYNSMPQYHYFYREDSTCNRMFSPKQLTDIIVWDKICTDVCQDKSLYELALKSWARTYVSRITSLLNCENADYRIHFDFLINKYASKYLKAVFKSGCVDFRYKLMMLLYVFCPYAVLKKVVCLKRRI